MDFEEIKDQVTDPKETKPEETPAQPEQPGAKPTISDAEAKLLKENMKMKRRLEEIEAAQSKEREEALQKQGEFKQLYEDAKPKIETLEKRIKAFEDATNAEIEEALKSVPKEKLEEIKALIDTAATPEGRKANLVRLAKLGLLEAPKPSGPEANYSGGGGNQSNSSIAALKERMAKTTNSHERTRLSLSIATLEAKAKEKR
jgi:hypothetical protein